MIEIAKYIDHTLLKGDAVKEDIKSLCSQAVKYGFASVCVNPYFIEDAAGFLADSDVKVGAVAGFPIGANCPNIKAIEAEDCVKRGAQEIDMVMNISALKMKDYDLVKQDIKGVVDRCKNISSGIVVKVIIENCYLTDDEKRAACEIVAESGADFVKTSTGMMGSGATVEDVKLMKSVVGDKIKVKAAGGVRTYQQALDMIEAGASRIGTSSGIGIISGR
ncbi:MAG: deoxyribose-phosphate aldolase [Clostridia bacterium]|nr:deoxyribose-phosphate aldolase [Clostridia bacterium]